MNKIMNKKGISTIVATVLIVLITVAAVTILWTSIAPLIDRDLSGEATCFNVQSKLTVDTNIGFTNYVKTADGGNILNIRIERGANSAALKGMDVIINDAGATVNTTNYAQGALPSENGAQVLTVINMTDATGVIDFSGPVTVSIAPRVIVNGEEKSCEKSRAVEIKLV